MAALSFTLALLLVVAMTTVKVEAKGTVLTDFLSVRAHKDNHYLLDVTSEDSVADLKAAMVNLTLDHGYKVVGEPHYFFVFRSNSSAALQSLTFPPRSQVTQLPVQRGDQYFQTLLDLDQEATGWWNYPDSNDSAANEIIAFNEWTMDLPKEMCLETFEMEMKSYVARAKGTNGRLNTAFYPVLASYPPRFFGFSQFEENALQNAVAQAVPTWGGMGVTRLMPKRVVRI